MNQGTTASNLAKQKEAAAKFVSDWPDTERIRFTEEGSFNGAGSWSAWAIVTIAGMDYQEDLGLDLVGGDPLPTPDPRTTPSPVSVTYSDGNSEALG